MKRAICPITKKVLDCKNCESIKDAKCPYWEFDQAVEYTIKFIRELIENEKI